MKTGAGYPNHNHPVGEELVGEELYVMEGFATVEGATLHAGDYLCTPPNFNIP